jgi:rhodanese-related sulfurtransferase
VRSISAAQLAQRLLQEGSRPVLLDVREPHEFQFCRIQGSVNVPMGQVFLGLGELQPQAETVVICHHGLRSAQVANYLEAHGFTGVYNLDGGVAAWAANVDRSMPTY